MQKLSTRSTPSAIQRSSGHTSAEPGVGGVDVEPGAACSAHTSAIGGSGSRAVDEVVPMLATTKNGTQARGPVLGHGGRQGVGPQREVRRPRRSTRSWSGRSPAMRTAFSTELCAWRGRVARAAGRTGPSPAARHRAASRAHSVAPDADSSMTPPPSPLERNRSGSPSSSAIQSSTCVSSSVHAGDGRPEHPLHAEAGRHEVGQHRRPGGAGREVGEPARVLPVGDARDDDPVEVGEDGARTAPAAPAATPAAAPAPTRARPRSAPDGPRSSRGSEPPTPPPRGRGAGTRRASSGRLALTIGH